MAYGIGLTDTQLRATPVPVSIPGSVAVTGSFWQATQPVSLATNTPDVIDRAARLLGHVTVDNTTLSVKQQSGNNVSSVLQATANTGAAAALALAAAGAGLFHYITNIVIQRVNNTVTAVAADTTVRQITSANFNGWAFELGSVLAAGGYETFIIAFGDVGIRSAVANTITSFSYPAGGAGTKIRMTVTYYTGT